MIVIFKKRKWKAIYVLEITNLEFYEKYRRAMKIPRIVYDGASGKTIAHIRKLGPKVKNGDKKEMTVIARTKLGARREAKIKAAYAAMTYMSSVAYKLESLAPLE